MEHPSADGSGGGRRDREYRANKVILCNEEIKIRTRTRLTAVAASSSIAANHAERIHVNPALRESPGNIGCSYKKSGATLPLQSPFRLPTTRGSSSDKKRMMHATGDCKSSPDPRKRVLLR